MNGRRSSFLFAPIFAAYLGVLAAAGMGQATAQRNAPDSAAYNVSAGKSSLKEIDGEHVLELDGGVRIDHGDITITSLRGEHRAVPKHTSFFGDVKITQETLTMWGEEGEYRGLTQIAIVRGNVRIVDAGWEVTADEVEYNRNTGRAWLRGNVVARDSSTTLRAGRLLYDREAETAEAFDSVRVSSPDEGFAASGEHGYYFRAWREGVIDRQPRLIVDPDSDDPVTVVSDTMRVFPDSSVALAYYTVKILKGDMITQCDSAVVFDDRQQALLVGNPLAKQGNVSMNSRRMRLFYDDEEVHRVDLLGVAEIREAHRDTFVIDRDNWISGDSIRLHLHDNSVDSIFVIDNATSEYNPSTPGKIERNSVHGEQMFFRFENDSLAYVCVEGAAEGVYRFVTISEGETTDSLRALADTLLTYKPFAKHAEKVVYSAQRIQYYARANDLVLEQSARLRYRQNTLTGKEITYYSDHELLDARGEPELSEGGQTFYGERMNYDLEEETGLVVQGATRFEQGFYTGEHVAKVDDGDMKVWRSVYTTCDLKEPHFHFRAKEMKVYPGDKVVSGPIVMYLGKTPVFYLPFMANNIERGRRSGFLRPDFDIGFNSREGRFIRNVGYYWATNDYTDFTFVADFNENSSARFFTMNRYKVRYRFDGSLNYNFLRDFRDFTNKWELRWAHNQRSLPWDMTFNSSLHYVSDEDVPQSINRIDDVDRIVDRRIESNGTLSKSWGRSVRLNLTGKRVQNLNVTDPNGVRISETLPGVTLSIPSRNLYFGKKSRQGEAGFWERVLSNLRYSPSLNGNRQYTARKYEFTHVETINTGLSLSSQPRIGFLTVSPGVSASNRTTRTDREIIQHFEPVTDTTDVLIPYDRSVDTENDFSWNTSVSARTNFYGTFYGRIGRLRAVRHAVSPSVGYTYTPARGSRAANQSVRLSLRNSFDLKVASGDSTTTEAGAVEERLDKLSNVVNWTLSTTYDPDVSQRDAWSNVSSSVAAQIARVGLSWNQTIDPYSWVVESQNATANFSIRGSHPFGRARSVELRERNIVAERDTVGAVGTAGASIEQTGDFLPGREDADSRLDIREGWLPWSIDASFSYSKTRFNEARSTVRLFGRLDLTRAWGLSYSMVYDLVDRVQSGQNIAVSRDLHCWEMSLARQRLGSEWQFYFRIALKAHPDIFGEAGRRGLGGGTIGTGSYF